MAKADAENSSDRGLYFETLALEFLQLKGLKLHSRNVSCRFGEIDLILQQAGNWVFVEVKYRASSAFGGALAAVTVAKQQKLLRSSRWYLQQYRLHDHACRLDVLAIEGQPPYRYQWIKNAITQ